MGKNFFSVIFYSFYILEGNYQEFKKTIQSYINFTNTDEFLFDGEKHIDFSIQGSRELARLIHNYAASWLSLVDHTRVIHRKLKDSKEQEVKNFTLEYENRLESLKNNVENSFIKDLRRYVQHKAIPVPSLYWRIKRVNSSNSPSETPITEMSCSF